MCICCNNECKEATTLIFVYVTQSYTTVRHPTVKFNQWTQPWRYWPTFIQWIHWEHLSAIATAMTINGWETGSSRVTRQLSAKTRSPVCNLRERYCAIGEKRRALMEPLDVTLSNNGARWTPAGVKREHCGSVLGALRGTGAWLVSGPRQNLPPPKGRVLLTWRQQPMATDGAINE